MYTVTWRRALITALICLGAPVLATASIVVTNYALVSSTRVDRTIFDYTYKVTFENTGTSVQGLSATVKSEVSTTQVRSGTIQVGTLAAGATVTPDGTITLRQDRTVPFSVQDLIWSFATASTTMLTPQQRTSSINAVKAYRASLEDLDLIQANQMLANFMRSRPEFADAGTSDKGINVWGTWRDGVVYMLVRNREGRSAAANAATPKPQLAFKAAAQFAVPLVGASPTAAPSPEDGKPANFPASKQIRLLTAMSGAWKDSRPKISQYFAPQLYEELPSDATVAGLRLLGGEGVLYFDTHGGSKSGMYALASATERSEALEEEGSQTFDDLAASRLVIMNACFDPIGAKFSCNSKVHPEWYSEHYGITQLFISKYWKRFADNSMVFLDACGSISADAQPLTDALLLRNVSRILGWSADTDDDVDGNGALFVFDRLLGANDIPPELPGKVVGKQRPFDVVSAVAACVGEQICGSLIDKARPVLDWKQLHQGCDECDFGILAPSIRQLFITSAAPGQPYDLFELVGFFGEDVGAGAFDARRTVRVGGTDIRVLEWSQHVILAGLPQVGTGSTGDVLVRTDDRVSNTARLTEWKVPFKFTLTDLSSLRLFETITAHFRGDVRTPVKIVDHGPEEPDKLFPHADPITIDINHLMRDTKVTYSCTGSAVLGSGDQREVFRWNGNGSASYKLPSGGSPVEFLSSTRILLGLDDLPSGSCPGTVTSKTGSTPLEVGFLMPSEVSPGDDTGLTLLGAAPFPLKLDQAGTVLPGSLPSRRTYSRVTGSASGSVEWPTTQPEAGTEPDPKAAR